MIRLSSVREWRILTRFGFFKTGGHRFGRPHKIIVKTVFSDAKFAVEFILGDEVDRRIDTVVVADLGVALVAYQHEIRVVGLCTGVTVVVG